MIIPRQGFEQWAVVAPDAHPSDRAYWQRVEREVADAPSALRFILPEIYLGEDDEARIESVRECMYSALENRVVEKLNRGLMMIEHATMSEVRHAILACIDLEEYAFKHGEEALIRASEEISPARVEALAAIRKNAPLELAHATVFYRDKRCKIMHSLLKEDLEEVYSFDLLDGGGHLAGYFLPEDIAYAVCDAMHTRGEPCFAVAAGGDYLAAAKAHWEALKPALEEEELARHPARFALVELINIYDDEVELYPIHRLACEVEADALADYFIKNVKCKRVGNVLYPAMHAGPQMIAKCDELLHNFMRQSGGRIAYVQGEGALKKRAAEEDCLGIAIKPLEKDDFFDYLKGGKCLPAKSFALTKSEMHRYLFECREISYD